MLQGDLQFRQAEQDCNQVLYLTPMQCATHISQQFSSQLSSQYCDMPHTRGLCTVSDQQYVGAGDQAHHWSECFPVGGDVHLGVLWGPALWCGKRLHRARALAALHSCLQCFCLDAVVQPGEFGAAFVLLTQFSFLCNIFRCSDAVHLCV